MDRLPCNYFGRSLTTSVSRPWFLSHCHVSVPAEALNFDFVVSAVKVSTRALLAPNKLYISEGPPDSNSVGAVQQYNRRPSPDLTYTCEHRG